MIYLGSTRVLTQDFGSHKYAEDYAGDHKSIVKMNGQGKVIQVINRFKSHEDSINYQTFLNNQSRWKDGNIYHCVSITGKQVDMSYDELGGNQIVIETYTNEGTLLTFRLAHLDQVLVHNGDFVDEGTILGYQGNTGLVLSSKATSNETYGSHVHLEIRNQDGTPLNPRSYATGEIKTTYKKQSNELSKDKDQFKVIVDNINIRQEPNTTSNILGMVYMNEVYTILETVKSSEYTWYKITTGRGVTGYVASKIGGQWVELMLKNEEIKPDPEVPDEVIDPTYELLFTCKKTGTYYVKLVENEQLYIKKNK